MRRFCFTLALTLTACDDPSTGGPDRDVSETTQPTTLTTSSTPSGTSTSETETTPGGTGSSEYADILPGDTYGGAPEELILS